MLRGTPKVQYKIRRKQIMKNVDNTDVWKTHPFDAFWTRVRSQSCGEWPPPPPPPPGSHYFRMCMYMYVCHDI